MGRDREGEEGQSRRGSRAGEEERGGQSRRWGEIEKERRGRAGEEERAE